MDIFTFKLWVGAPQALADSGKEQILKETTVKGEDISGSGGNWVQGNLLGIYKDDPS